MSFNRPIPFILTLSVITAFCLSGFHYVARNIENNAVLLLSADSIITMNPMEPRIEAAALQNGKNIATGNLEQLKQQWPETEHRAFSGKTLTPGFVEKHLHPAMATLLLPFH